jgi:hypothetical protein
VGQSSLAASHIVSRRLTPHLLGKASPDLPMTQFSVLDLAPVPEGFTPGDALRNTLDLAKHADRLGFNR